MNKEIGKPVVVAILVVVVVVLVVFGYRVLGSPKSNMTAAEQRESMRHMIPPRK